MSEKDTVVITGFGPFDKHQVNASWEVVKSLVCLRIEDELGIKLVPKQVAVAYTTVTKEIPQLWKEFNPSLMIHLGVSGIARRLTLECHARKTGYLRKDIYSELPCEGKCCFGECEDITTELDLQKVLKDIQTSGTSVSACTSQDAGRYLCEFIYYTSLSINRTRTLFIHVPDIGEPYSAKEMAEGIKIIIASLLEQIRKQKCEDTNENLI